MATARSSSRNKKMSSSSSSSSPRSINKYPRNRIKRSRSTSRLPRPYSSVRRPPSGYSRTHIHRESPDGVERQNRFQRPITSRYRPPYNIIKKRIISPDQSRDRRETNYREFRPATTSPLTKSQNYQNKNKDALKERETQKFQPADTENPSFNSFRSNHNNSKELTKHDEIHADLSHMKTNNNSNPLDSAIQKPSVPPNNNQKQFAFNNQRNIRGPPYKQGEWKRPFNQLIPDRSVTPPFLLRVFLKINGDHQLSDFAVMSKEPVQDELQLYFWMDTTLRELVDLVKDVSLESRNRNSFWKFKLIYQGKQGKIATDEIGTVHSTRVDPQMDNKTLQQINFHIGDYIGISINTARRRRLNAKSEKPLEENFEDPKPSEDIENILPETNVDIENT